MVSANLMLELSLKSFQADQRKAHKILNLEWNTEIKPLKNTVVYSPEFKFTITNS